MSAHPKLIIEVELRETWTPKSALAKADAIIAKIEEDQLITVKKVTVKDR